MVEYDCPVKLTAHIIGGKWKPLILFYLKVGHGASASLANSFPA